MKKLLFIFVLVFLANTLCAQTAISPSVGDGSSGNPYQIATLNNLYWITQNSGQWNKVYQQTADIDATPSSFWDDGSGFSPIGNSTTPFTGSYDGQAYKITGISIGRSTNYIGFFGNVHGAVIKNVKLDSVKITGYQYVGGLIGFQNDSSIAVNCCIIGSVNGGANYVGGLIGEQINYSIVTNCYSSGAVTGNNQLVGGLIGEQINSTAMNCYSIGSVTGGSYVGGLIGFQNDYYTTTTNCYSNCLVTCTTSSSYVGGLIGVEYFSNSAINCFWDTSSSGQTYSAGGIGKSTAQMKNYLTYTGWSFKGLTGGSIWNIGHGRNNGYPYLDWQYVATVQLSSNTMNFDTVRIGQFKETTITISNTGNDTLEIGTITSSNLQFSIRPTVISLPPGIRCTDTLRFTPAVSGTTSAIFLIASNSPSSPDTIKVSGVGFGPAIQFNTKTISFGNVNIGTFKDTTVTITNTGNDTLKISSIASSRSTFTARPTAWSIAPGQSFADTLRFASITVGADSAFLVIQSNSGSSPDTVKVSGIAKPITNVEQLTGLPKVYALSQNYPNPFNPSTTISFSLPRSGFTTLKIYDLMGREVTTIVSEELPAGTYSRQWNAANISSGIYFYRLQAGSFIVTKKLLLLK